MFLVEFLCYLLPILSICSNNVERSIQYKDCGSTPSIMAADVSPCPTEQCELVKGKVTNLTLTFKIDETVTAVTAKADGILGTTSIPYPLPQPDGCKDSGLTCPLKPGTFTYKNGLAVPAIAPSGIRLVVKYELIDQNEKSIVCIEFPAKIVD